MKLFTLFTSFVLALVPSLVLASPASNCLYGACSSIEARSLSVSQIASELGPQLSNSSSIFGSHDPRWTDATLRFQALTKPNIQLVVQPAEEHDVSTIVKYANKKGIAFMATNRRHALTLTVGRFSGIEIDLSLLRDVTINEAASSATLQGGAYAEDVWTELWDKGYITTSGSAACVGLLGPGLGGGHGRWQGYYGLISDNFIKLNVVLANGTAITVSSTSNPDLFWAMKGAGHNFGIATSVEMKIYDRGPDTWYYKNYVFNQTNIETVFQALNDFRKNGTQPKEMAVNYGAYTMFPTVSSTEPVLYWSFAYVGSAEDAQQYLTPFDAIEAIDVEDGNVPYPQIADVTMTGASSALCVAGFVHNHATAYLKTWNVTAQRQIYDLFRKNVNENAEWFNSSVVMEDYSHEGVAAVDPASSAYPWREFSLLTYINVDYAVDTRLNSKAQTWAEQTRSLWNAGQADQPVATYVNYARGQESQASMYGYDSWRLKKLRALKSQYDPKNRFGYYNAITV
ncbi:Glucooligosaccharide oxidase [Xylaria sp. FL0043]|nr:Glucooligosaccharide oxidase [Xylaria sp. FL0043]